MIVVIFFSFFFVLIIIIIIIIIISFYIFERCSFAGISCRSQPPNGVDWFINRFTQPTILQSFYGKIYLKTLITCNDGVMKENRLWHNEFTLFFTLALVVYLLFV